jgi:predicted dehydrogenase
MTRPLRVGVIGVGNFGERHVRAYARQPDVSIVGIVDRDPDRARLIAARWGIENWFQDSGRLFRESDPDGVSVVTPGEHHLEPTLLALEHGCAVLLDKPVAMSSGDVAAIEAAVAESTAFVQPAHILRFAAPYIALRNRVRSGALGQLLAISSSRDRPRSHSVLFPGIHPAFMTTVHDIDLALWITGSRAVRVTAHERGVNGSEQPHLVWAQVEAAGGSVWSLRTSWVLPDTAQLADRLEVYGTEGAVALEFNDHELTPETHAGALDAEIGHFCTCIREGVASSVITLAEAACGIQIAEAMMASASQRGVPIDLD